MHPHELPTDLLPWAPEAEAGVLTALLANNAAWDQVGDLLEARHFYDLTHAAIFSAIGGLVLAGKPADVLTVHEAMSHRGGGDGLLNYLLQLDQSPLRAAHVRSYAEMVRERAMQRELIEAADRVKELATAPGLSTSQRLDQAQSALQQVQAGAGRTMPTAVRDSLPELLDRLQDVADGKADPGIRTGIPGLDRMLGGGLKPGKQIVLAARPSVGKSSLAMQILLNLAMDGVPVGFFSMEMLKSELTERSVANLGRVNLDRITTGKLEDEDWSRLTDAVERLGNLPQYLDDKPAMTLHDVAAKARALVRQHGVKAIGLDYLQLMDGASDNASRHHQIETISRGLKSLSKQLGITFITLSQLNREVEKRTTGRPSLSDLKESGAIEEDADVVVLLSRNGEPSGGVQVVNCELPKNRQGRTGLLSLAFEGAHQRWTECAAPVAFKTPARRHFTEDV